MATVVVTFFLISQVYVCNMDADCIRTQREFSKREKRWSMNSQRLDEIVAELMKPISDVRRSFDTDLSALLEEYLTEAGLHALDAGEAGGGAADVTGGPNFAELALLLQQSASIYSRKVDCLYQHVLSVSDSLHNSTLEAAVPSGCEPATPSARRKRKASAAELQFAPVELAGGGGAARREGGGRPPPTLPRAHDELAPRAPAPADRVLADYDGEPIGLLADFHVCWRLENGLLVEELATGWAVRPGWRPPALDELRVALTEGAPPSPPLCASPPSSPPRCVTPPRDACETPPPCVTPLRCITPPPCVTPRPFDTPPPSSTPLPTKVEKMERKRKNDVNMQDVVSGSVKLLISKELRRSLRREYEFSLPSRWVARVVRSRRVRLLAARRAAPSPETDFHGFDDGGPPDVGGFGGWSAPEAAAATAEASIAADASARLHDDSDDDGFFERSSLGDSDTSRADDTARAPAAGADDGTAAWRARVLGAAAAAERRGGDVHEAAATLLRALPAAPPTAPPASAPPALPFRKLLADVAREPHDVAKYFLATLFLANAGNVEVVQGAALSPGAFSVRLLSADSARYRRTIAADAAPAPP